MSDSSASSMEYEPKVSVVRSRERPRSRGRGERRGGSRRGRGRSGSRVNQTRSKRRGGSSDRGRTNSVEKSDRERVADRLRERKEGAKALIGAMAETTLRELCVELVDREPGLLFDLLEKAPEVPGGYHPSPDTLAPSWCKCHHCREMPTDLERKCCECLPSNCVSMRHEFDQYILDQGVLKLSAMQRREYFGGYNAQQLEHSKSMRHTAYRQFILWMHGQIGTGNRRVIPSCCVWRIRDTFPDIFNSYTGFRPTNAI